jgi:hypothetical protein
MCALGLAIRIRASRGGGPKVGGGHVRRLDIRITFGTPVSKTYRRRECEGCPFQGRICMKSDSRLHFLALQLHSITRFDACRVAREHVNSLVFLVGDRHPVTGRGNAPGNRSFFRRIVNGHNDHDRHGHSRPTIGPTAGPPYPNCSPEARGGATRTTLSAIIKTVHHQYFAVMLSSFKM